MSAIKFETVRAMHAPSVTRVAICVSRVLIDGLQKKERLLVVYLRQGEFAF